MNHSVRDRIKVTGTGKLIRRKMGLNHFRAKKSAKRLHRKSDSLVKKVDLKMFKKYL
ncbi:MAG: bL35 family ribosomal protein [bacterium]|nr:bL35 family ribosomal protein [bacterium]